MKTTIGWAAVGADGGLVRDSYYCNGERNCLFRISDKRFPGSVRVEIREAKEKKRKAGRKGEK